jgi:hypothetical protein
LATGVCRVLVARGFRLPQRNFEGPRIDRKEQLALLDVRPFGEVHGQQLTGDLRPDFDRRIRLGGANGGHLDRHRLLGSQCRGDRNGCIAPAAAGAAAASSGGGAVARDGLGTGNSAEKTEEDERGTHRKTIEDYSHTAQPV